MVENAKSTIATNKIYLNHGKTLLKALEVSAEPIAAKMKEKTTAGPAFSAAAIPVRENNPAPIMAPIPKATKDVAESVFFNPFSLSSASSRSW
jgi:hypothetical protein